MKKKLITAAVCAASVSAMFAGQVFAEAPAEQPSHLDLLAEAAEITMDEAAAIALEEFSLDQEDTEFIDVVFEIEEGDFEYDVEIVVDGIGYYCDVNAYTGEVVSRGHKIVREMNPEGCKDVTPGITADEAKAAALEELALKEEDVKLISLNLTVEDGYLIYYVAFKDNDNKRYCKVDAMTGEICTAGWKKDHDGDDAPVIASLSEIAQVKADEAQAIALEQAGLKEDEVESVDMAFEIEDGELEYDVNIAFDGKEYYCDVNAFTGEVVSGGQEIIREMNPEPDYSAEPKITWDEAKVTAQEALGVTAEEIEPLELSYDTRDGYLVYYFRFEKDGVRHYCKIDAMSGEVCVAGWKQIH